MCVIMQEHYILLIYSFRHILPGTEAKTPKSLYAEEASIV